MEPRPRRTARPGRPRASNRPEEVGLVTLEWLLLVAAVGGLAAVSVVAIQRVLDDTAERPADPHVRVLDADIAATLLAAEADAAALAGTYSDDDFTPRCEDLLRMRFNDVVRQATWRGPDTMQDPEDPDRLVLDTPAKCRVELQLGLEG